MLGKNMTDASQPRMSIAFLHPIMDDLKAAGCNEEVLCQQLAVPLELLQDQTQRLLANQVYHFLKWATDYFGDQGYCFRLGERMAGGGWAPIKPLFEQNRTVIDFISDFGALSEQQGRSARYKLEVDGKVAILSLTRPSGASAVSRYADAIAAGFFLTILGKSNQSLWDTTNVAVVLPNRDLIAEDRLPRSSILAGRKGMNIRFPSKYLGADLSKPASFAVGPQLEGEKLSDAGFLERVQQIINLRIVEGKTGPVEVAQALGMRKWKLQEELGKSGTSVSQLRNELKFQAAQQRLLDTSDSVKKIADDLGYSDSANFARAFRKWAGVSPKEFRKAK